MLGAVGVVVVLHAVLAVTPGPPLRDSMGYITLGERLARGDTYTFFGLHGGLWPAGLPVMLAAVFTVAPGSIVAAKAMLAGWLLLTAWMTFRLGRPLVGPRLAGLVALAFALNPCVIRLHRAVLSEPPFAALLLMSLLLWVRWQRGDDLSGRPRIGAWGFGALAGAAAAGATAVRTLGVALGPALALAALVSAGGRGRRRRSRVAWGGAWVVCVIVGMAAGSALHGGAGGGGFLGSGAWKYVHTAGREGQYDAGSEQLSAGAFALRTVRELGRWVLESGAAMMGTKAPEAGVVAGPLLVVAMVIVLLRGRAGPLAPAPWIFFGYGAIVAATAFGAGVRYAVPLLPLCWLAFLTAADRLAGAKAPRLAAVLRYGAICVLVGSTVAGAGTVLYHAARLRLGPDAALVRGPFELKPDQVEEMALLDRYIPPDAPTISDNAALIRRLTGRPMYPTIALADPSATSAQFDVWGIRYASLGKNWTRNGRLAFDNRPWPLLARTPRILLLRRPPPDAPDTPTTR